MRRLAILFAMVFILAVVPSADAATTRAWTFTTNPHPSIDGAYSLESDGANTAGRVDLAAGEIVTWAEEAALAVGANLAGGQVTFDISLTQHAGSITVSYGWMMDGVFHSAGTSGAKAVQAESRGTIPSGVASTFDMGRAAGNFSTNAIAAPAGAYPAFQIVSDVANGVETQPTLLGASTSSSATVPLPELPAIVLGTIGLAIVGGVAVIRQRR